VISVWNISLGTRRRPEAAFPGSGVNAVFGPGIGARWLGADAVQTDDGTRVSAARERSP
jgi:hypothetical protein